MPSSIEIQIEKCLDTFDAIEEWPDVIAFLSKLVRIIGSQSFFEEGVPFKWTIGRRLAQCLNPSLPTGVHSKALELYGLIFQRISAQQLSNDVEIYALGLLPYGDSCPTLMRHNFLSLVDKFFSTIYSSNVLFADSVVACLISLLDEKAGESFDYSIRLLSTIQRDIGASLFHRSVLKCLRFFGGRQRQLSLLCLCKLVDGVTDESIIDLSLCTFSSALQDEDVTTVRECLDYIARFHAVDSKLVHNHHDGIKLLITSSFGCLRLKELSLSRRLSKWWGLELQVRDEGVTDIMIEALGDLINLRSQDGQYLCSILVPLLDFSSLSQLLANNLMLPLLRSAFSFGTIDSLVAFFSLLDKQHLLLCLFKNEPETNAYVEAIDHLFDVVLLEDVQLQPQAYKGVLNALVSACSSHGSDDVKLLNYFSILSKLVVVIPTCSSSLMEKLFEALDLHFDSLLHRKHILQTLLKACSSLECNDHGFWFHIYAKYDLISLDLSKYVQYPFECRLGLSECNVVLNRLIHLVDRYQGLYDEELASMISQVARCCEPLAIQLIVSNGQLAQRWSKLGNLDNNLDFVFGSAHKRLQEASELCNSSVVQLQILMNAMQSFAIGDYGLCLKQVETILLSCTDDFLSGKSQLPPQSICQRKLALGHEHLQLSSGQVILICLHYILFRDLDSEVEYHGSLALERLLDPSFMHDCLASSFDLDSAFTVAIKRGLAIPSLKLLAFLVEFKACNVGLDIIAGMCSRTLCSERTEFLEVFRKLVVVSLRTNDYESDFIHRMLEGLFKPFEGESTFPICKDIESATVIVSFLCTVSKRDSWRQIYQHCIKAVNDMTCQAWRLQDRGSLLLMQKIFAILKNNDFGLFFECLSKHEICSWSECSFLLGQVLRNLGMTEGECMKQLALKNGKLERSASNLERIELILFFSGIEVFPIDEFLKLFLPFLKDHSVQLLKNKSWVLSILNWLIVRIMSKGDMIQDILLPVCDHVLTANMKFIDRQESEKSFNENESCFEVVIGLALPNAKIIFPLQSDVDLFYENLYSTCISGLFRRRSPSYLSLVRECLCFFPMKETCSLWKRDFWDWLVASNVDHHLHDGLFTLQLSKMLGILSLEERIRLDDLFPRASATGYTSALFSSKDLQYKGDVTEKLRVVILGVSNDTLTLNMVQIIDRLQDLLAGEDNHKEMFTLLTALLERLEPKFISGLMPSITVICVSTPTILISGYVVPENESLGLSQARRSSLPTSMSFISVDNDTTTLKRLFSV